MTKMNAAVVTAFDRPPQYEQFDVPEPSGEGQELVEVIAVGLHPRVRSGAAGAHYTSTGVLPMIPGIDGVARRSDGKRIYFVADDSSFGAMAEQALADPHHSIELPDDVDAATVAASMNPAMSAWVALRHRVPIQVGQSVLVLGATGNAGTMAVQIAKRLGAGHVIGAGRDLTRLHALTDIGADAAVQLTDNPELTDRDLAAAAADVDIVIDYLWGKPTEHAIIALLSARADRSRQLNWIQIGAIAGPTIELPSVALRSANLRLQGNGQGAVSTRVYLEQLPSLIEEIRDGAIGLRAIPQALADVEKAWSQSDAPGTRTVLMP